MGKGLEALKDIRDICSDMTTVFDGDLDTIEKELMALKIIIQNREFEFNIGYNEEHDYWTVFCECEGDGFCLASGSGKEEYEILKEVLVNE